MSISNHADAQPFEMSEKQLEATDLMASKRFTLLRGGGRSGKTFITIRNIILRALHTPSRHLIARQTLTSLKSSILEDTLPKVLRICFPGYKEAGLMHLNKSDFVLNFSNGSQIWFGGLDNEERIDKILGNEYSSVFLNECSIIEWKTFLVVRTRLAENVGLPQMCVLDCNPPTKSHWTYKVFMKGIDPDTGEKLIGFEEKYGTIQINPKDNQKNLTSEFIDDMQSLPLKERLRFWDGEFGNDTEGALWNMLMIDKALNMDVDEPVMTVVSIDPAVTNQENSDETGICVASRTATGKGIVHKDYSLKGSPQTWAMAAVNAYNKHDANYIVVEVNQGGDMVKAMIHAIDDTIPVVEVRASKGKFARAEPVAALYEQNRIAHDERMPVLEEQLTEYVPLLSKKSPDRLDALVWALTFLILGMKAQPRVRRV